MIEFYSFRAIPVIRSRDLSGLAFIASAQPGRDSWSIGMDLAGLEIKSNLALRGLGTVGGMDQIHLPAGAKLAADRAGRCLESARRSEHFADHSDGFQS